MADEYEHLPALFDETMAVLQPRANGLYIDGTLGAGGHSAGILERSAPQGRLLGFDRDPEAIQFARQRLSRFGERATFVNANFARMGEIAPLWGFHRVNGIVLDLGLSSRQLDNPTRGFSFMRDGDLDMRFDPRQGQSAAQIINNSTETELAEIFWRYGEERRSRRIAKLIVAARPLRTTSELASLIANNVRQQRRIHPATLVFQALRIAVNDELNALEQGLDAGIQLLEPGGRMGVISFHSLEDRIVKRKFRFLSQSCICPPEQPICACDHKPTINLIKRKAIKASASEIKKNPRSRSARLRIAEKRVDTV